MYRCLVKTMTSALVHIFCKYIYFTNTTLLFLFCSDFILVTCLKNTQKLKIHRSVLF